MNVFTSQLEKVMPAKELRFDATPGFGVYKRFLEHSIAHPAKMNTRLLEFLIDEFTVPGETVLDPMSGSGSTGVLAALHGRNAVCVELEQKFYEWMEQARMEVERQQTLTLKGKIKNICGDARQLSQILKEVDIVVTSPPYHPGKQTGKGLTEKGRKILEQTQKRRYTDKSVTGALPYSEDPGNIGNLPHGKVDAVITSPPYKTGTRGSGIARRWHTKDATPEDHASAGYRDKSKNRCLPGLAEGPENPENIDNLPYGVDAVITSPPYADSKKGDEDEERMASNLEKHGLTKETRRDRHTPGRLRAMKSMVSGYSESEENIGNLPFADVVITSPPMKKPLRSMILIS